MSHISRRTVKTVSLILTLAIFIGFLPWREISADSNTQGSYNSYPFSITYDQNSTWNNSTQGQYVLTNTSDYTVTSWTLELEFLENVTVSNIWSASDITDYNTDDNIKISGNATIPAGESYTFGLIADGENNAPVAPVSITTIQYESDEPTPTPTVTATPTEEPTATPTITDIPTVTPTNEPSATPTNTNTPTPTPIEEETEVFPYAIFAGSRSTDLTVQGWKSNITTYTYDSLGNLTTVEEPSGTITYTYNSDGLLTGVTNANGETISYSYNNGYQLAKITIDGQEINYGYDNQGRLTTVTDSEGTTTYSYDANGNRVSTEYPNGVVTTYEYNSINALTRQVSKDNSNNILASYEYTIGANGERLSCMELNRTVEYTYDELNRLTSETVTRGNTISVTEYTYDANSNRTSMTKDGTVTTYTYNSLNQITQAGNVTYTWDNAGNLVSQSSLGTTQATYTYDSRNRMISANVNSVQGTITESYTYDYLGNRTSKTSGGVTTEFTTDLSSGYSQVLKASTGTEPVYYTRGFELISRRVGTTASYYLYDGGLSVCALTDESGVVTDTQVFDAFGNETERTGTTENSYGFQGEEGDSTGLYYLRARYMDPATSTFTSMDTYAGSLSDPTSLHRYLFANANPVMYCDPSGHNATLEDLLGAMTISTILLSTADAASMYLLQSLSEGSFTVSGFAISVGKGLLKGIIAALIMAALTILAVIAPELWFFIAGITIFGICKNMGRVNDAVGRLRDDNPSNDPAAWGDLLWGVANTLRAARNLPLQLSNGIDGCYGAPVNVPNKPSDDPLSAAAYAPEPNKPDNAADDKADVTVIWVVNPRIISNPSKIMG